jgi:hypothetical protein
MVFPGVLKQNCFPDPTMLPKSPAFGEKSEIPTGFLYQIERPSCSGLMWSDPCIGTRPGLPGVPK